MIEFVIMFLAVALLAFLIWRNKKKDNDAIEQGDMVKRENKFFQQSHTFKTDIQDIKDIYDALDWEILTNNSIKYSLSGKEIIFERYVLGQGMTAALSYKSRDNEGKQLYQFEVHRFTTRKGMMAGVRDANISLTTVEKAVFKLDSKATVERLNAKYKTDTKW